MGFGIVFDIVNLIIFTIIGILSVKWNKETLNEYEQKVEGQHVAIKTIARKFLKPLRYSNSLIGRSVEKNSAFLLGWAIIVLFLYYFLIGIFFLIIKYVVYTIISLEAKPNFIEAFALLLGAGVQSFIVWTNKIKERSTSEGLNFKMKTQNFFQSFFLFVNLLIWSLGELAFLLLSPDIAFVEGTTQGSIFLRGFLIFVAIFAFYVVFKLIKYGVNSKAIKIVIYIVYLPIFLYVLFGLLLMAFAP